MRAPNHLGDLVMALPALAAEDRPAVLVVRSLAPLASLGVPENRIIAFDRGARGFIDAAGRLRTRRWHSGVLLPPSFSSALLCRAGGVRRLRGLATDGRRFLLHEAIPRARAAALHRAALYVYLVSGKLPATSPVPELVLPVELAARGAAFVGGAGARRRVGVFPASNATSRRWDPDRFREVARRLAAEGDHVVVFGGPADVGLTRFVAGEAAYDAGGRTDLPLLAAALAACDILITNDSGPLHLAAAVGTATVSLWGAGNPAVTGVTGAAHQLLRRPDLACVPCVRNECPRQGPGDQLPEAERECLRLIEVQDVLTAAAPRS